MTTKAKQHDRLDDDESIFFGRQLESVKSQTYDKKFTELKARSLCPVSFDAGPGAESIKYEQFDMVGQARIITDYANDFSTADVKAKEFVSPIKSLGSSYKYSIQEIRAAAFAGKPLVQRKANAAKRTVMQLENRICYFGDADHNLPGWFTNANIPDVALPADGGTSGTDFADKIGTPDKIIRDLNSIANAVVNQSNGVHSPDTMLTPLAQFTLTSSTPRTGTSDTTVMAYFLANNPFISQWEWVNELAAANSFGNLAADTALAYKRDPDNLSLEVPQDFEQFAPEQKALAFNVAVHQRIGGTLIYYPLSMAKSDDV